MARVDRRALASISVALALVVVGALRFVTDSMHDQDPNYWRGLADSPLRYVVRAPSDGTLLGDLNAQFFKILALPCGISLIYLGRRVTGEPLERWVRILWIVLFFLAFTAIELEKQLHLFGLGSTLVAGERPWLNHVVHVVSAALAYVYSGLLSAAPLRPDAFADDT